jgi:catechol 2,3-dioxygenase-like lactoylglutathione lyase family enzyme
MAMRLMFVNVTVADQEAALRFYVDILGFRKMADIPMGTHRFLSVASPEGIEGVQLILEPLNFPEAAALQRARHAAGVAAISLVSTDIQADYARLSGLGVRFAGPPEDYGMIVATTFDDTCGNLVFLTQPKRRPV